MGSWNTFLYPFLLTNTTYYYQWYATNAYGTNTSGATTVYVQPQI